MEVVSGLNGGDGGKYGDGSAWFGKKGLIW